MERNREIIENHIKTVTDLYVYYSINAVKNNEYDISTAMKMLDVLVYLGELKKLQPVV